MNSTLLLFLIISIIGGIFHGFSEIDKVKKDPKLGVKPSNNLCSFLFTDKY